MSDLPSVRGPDVGASYFDDDDRPWYERLDPAVGLSLDHAMLFYADSARAKRYAELCLAGFGPPSKYSPQNPPPGVDPRDPAFRAQWHAYEREGNALIDRLLEVLVKGDLRAMGFDPSVSVDSGPTAIHPDRWRVLIPDIETSSATLLGKTIVGIRIFPGSAKPKTSEAARPNKPGPKSHTEAMVSALEELLKEGKRFPTKKAAHKAVLSRLDVDGTARGWSYDTFVKCAGHMLQNAAD